MSNKKKLDISQLEYRTADEMFEAYEHLGSIYEEVYIINNIYEDEINGMRVIVADGHFMTDMENDEFDTEYTLYADRIKYKDDFVINQ